MINFSQLNLLEKYYYWKNIISEKYADTEYLSVFSPNAGKYGPENSHCGLHRKIEKEIEPTEQTIGWLVAFRQEISIVEFSLLPCFFCVKIYFIFLSVFSTRKFPNKVDWLNFPELELMY